MSFIFRDPFFDDFDDYMTSRWPFNSRYPSAWALDDEEATSKKVHSKKTQGKKEDSITKMRRDMITPFSGFSRMDMNETDKSYQLRVDVPGMEKSEIKITTDNNTLIIEGERKQEKNEDSENGKCHFMERHFGSFHREMSLPANADGDHIDAVYDNGVLKVTIPKVEVPSNKKMITVN